jgi:hypothetical protein
MMAGRGLRARMAGAPRGLRLGVVALAGLGLGAGIARGWRWLTGSGWDSKDVAELYGEQTNRGYGAGLSDVVSRREANPARPQRTEHQQGPGAGP